MNDLYPGKPKVADITLDRSSDTDLQLTFKVSELGALIDLTGYAFQMKIATEWGRTTDQILAVTIDVDLPTSTVTIHFTAAALSAVDAGTYKYKFIGTRAGKPRTYLKGAFILED